MKKLCLAVILGWGASQALPAQESPSASQAKAPYSAPKVPKLRSQPWPAELIEQIATLPLQESGRVKPLETYARFLIFVIRGSRGPIKVEYREEDGGGEEKLDHVAWLLDCWFFPEQAKHYPVFRVDDVEALRAIGLEVDTPKRADKLSYAQIQPIVRKLGTEGNKIRKIESDNRTPLQRQILDVADRFPRLGLQIQAMDFARDEFMADNPELEKALGGKGPFAFFDVMKKRQGIQNLKGEGVAVLESYLGRLHSRVSGDNALYMYAFAPSRLKDQSEWGRIGDLVATEFEQRSIEASMREQLEILWSAARGPQTVEAIGAALLELKKQSVTSINGNPRYQGTDLVGQVEREYRFYQKDYFYKAVVAFWIAFFIGMPVVWLLNRRAREKGMAVPALSWPQRLLIWAPGLVAFGLLFVGILTRCMIRGRPPVTTPYEGWLFIAGVVFLAGMIAELVRRSRGRSLLYSNLLAALVLMVARWQELEEGGDTIQPLVAVLDTNFWLSIHVTTITAGYGAALLAALLGIAYLFYYFTGNSKRWPDQIRFLNSFIYGVVCFGAAFATVGTILGGVWANDSWGRFWGWDPKENGALMLCLGLIVMLHGRMGGYIRHFGMAVCSIILGIITMWAFWGVNLLGVGLHSYGFDESKAVIMNWIYLGGWSIVGLAVMGWGIQRLLQGRTAAKSEPDLSESPGA